MEENIPIVRIAVSYAREDLELLKQLKKHLAPLIIGVIFFVTTNTNLRSKEELSTVGTGPSLNADWY